MNHIITFLQDNLDKLWTLVATLVGAFISYKATTASEKRKEKRAAQREKLKDVLIPLCSSVEAVMDAIDLSIDVSDEEILKLIRKRIIEKGRTFAVSLAERKRIEAHVFNSLRKLDVLEDLLNDEEITEIMINGPKNNLILFREISGMLIDMEEWLLNHHW